MREGCAPGFTRGPFLRRTSIFIRTTYLASVVSSILVRNEFQRDINNSRCTSIDIMKFESSFYTKAIPSNHLIDLMRENRGAELTREYV